MLSYQAHQGLRVSQGQWQVHSWDQAQTPESIGEMHKQVAQTHKSRTTAVPVPRPQLRSMAEWGIPCEQDWFMGGLAQKNMGGNALKWGICLVIHLV